METNTAFNKDGDINTILREHLSLCNVSHLQGQIMHCLAMTQINKFRYVKRDLLAMLRIERNM